MQYSSNTGILLSIVGWGGSWEQLGNIFRAAFNEDYRDYDVQ